MSVKSTRKSALLSINVPIYLTSNTVVKNAENPNSPALSGKKIKFRKKETTLLYSFFLWFSNPKTVVCSIIPCLLKFVVQKYYNQMGLSVMGSTLVNIFFGRKKICFLSYVVALIVIKLISSS